MLRCIGRCGFVVVLLLSLAVSVSAQAATECEAGFRLFEHELLINDAVCVPENAERIAALDRFSFEMMLSLGVEPIAASSFALKSVEDLPYLVPLADDVVDLGQPPNLELLLATDPDLILSSTGYGEYDQLAAIAPTVQVDFSSSEQWKEVAQFFGQAIGAEEATDALFAQYDERLATFAELVGNPGDIEVSVVRVAADYISLYFSDSFLGVVLADAGLVHPQAQLDQLANDANFDGTLSPELLNLANGDVMFIWTFATAAEAAAGAQEALEALQADPLWATLPVIQNERAYTVGGYWIGSGLPAAHAVIDDLFRYIAEADPAEVSPNPFEPVAVEATAEATEASS